MNGRSNAAAVVRQMSAEELEALDAQIRKTENLIGDRRKERQAIDFTDRRTQADRRLNKNRNL